MSNLFDLPVHKCPASQFLRRSCKVEAGDSRFSPVTCTEYYDLWRARRQCCWRLFEYSTAATSFPGDHSFSPLDHMWTDKLAMWPKWRIYSRLAVACTKDDLLAHGEPWVNSERWRRQEEFRCQFAFGYFLGELHGPTRITSCVLTFSSSHERRASYSDGINWLFVKNFVASCRTAVVLALTEFQILHRPPTILHRALETLHHTFQRALATLRRPGTRLHRPPPTELGYVDHNRKWSTPNHTSSLQRVSTCRYKQRLLFLCRRSAGPCAPFATSNPATKPWHEHAQWHRKWPRPS
jgi:hypothetical protein